MLATINELRLAINYAPVTMDQVIFHFIHRAWAVVVVALVAFFTIKTLKIRESNFLVKRTALYLGLGVFLQFILGVFTVLSVRQPYFASIHVMVGALMLGVAALAALRAYPGRPV